MQVTRGGEFEAAFKSAQTLTVLDANVYISAANTVDYADTSTKIAIGNLTGESLAGSSSSCKVNLFAPSKRGICGGTVTAGGKVSANGYKMIDATTGTAVEGIAVTGATVDGEKFEYIPMKGIAAVS